MEKAISQIDKSKMGAGKALKNAEMVFLALLTIGLMGLLFLIIYGNLSGNLGFIDVATTVTNESIALAITTGIGTISDATNINFVSWNATAIYNRTVTADIDVTNETLIEGTDYIIFPTNGTFGNLTDEWNTTFVSYVVLREAQGETNTDAVIANLTGGATVFFSFANVWFILTAITILIGIVLGVVALVRNVGGGGYGGKKGRTEFTT